MKTQTSEANLGNLNFSNPLTGEQTDPKIFMINFDIWKMSKLEFVCKSYGYFTNGLRIRGQNGLKVGKICGGG